MCSLSNEMTHPTIDVDAVRIKINDDSVRLIDVRREEEYNQGNIPNAGNLPIASLLSGDSPESAEKLFEKYTSLAKEAISSGDKTSGENYLQHADHFMRIIEDKNRNKENRI